MQSKVASNVDYLYAELSNSRKRYSDTILSYNSQFDVIIIDGRERVNCAKNSLNALTSRGVIIWDNSDRVEYQDGYDFLTKNSFKRIDFSGIGPINNYGWTTSVFYREDNCFEI